MYSCGKHTPSFDFNELLTCIPFQIWQAEVTLQQPKLAIWHQGDVKYNKRATITIDSSKFQAMQKQSRWTQVSVCLPLELVHVEIGAAQSAALYTQLPVQRMQEQWLASSPFLQQGIAIVAGSAVAVAIAAATRDYADIV